MFDTGNLKQEKHHMMPSAGFFFNARITRMTPSVHAPAAFPTTASDRLRHLSISIQLIPRRDVYIAGSSCSPGF